MKNILAVIGIVVGSKSRSCIVWKRIGIATIYNYTGLVLVFTNLQVTKLRRGNFQFNHVNHKWRNPNPRQWHNTYHICSTSGTLCQIDVIIDRVAFTRIAGQLVMYYKIHSAVREAYQSRIGQKILNSVCIWILTSDNQGYIHTHICFKRSHN